MVIMTQSGYITGFNIAIKSSPNGTVTGAVALLINKGHHFRPVQLDTPLQAVAARITLTKRILSSVIYLPPSQNVFQTDLTNTIEQLPSPFVLLGDFNGHSPLWGCDQYNNNEEL